MRIITRMSRLGAFWLALLIGAMPLAASAEEPPAPVLPRLDAPAALESPPATLDELPPLISPRPADATDRQKSAAHTKTDASHGESDPDTASTPPSSDSDLAAKIAIAIDGAASSKKPPLPAFPFGYNLRQSSLSWMVGRGDDFGGFSLESNPTLSVGESCGIVASTGFHFLCGPTQTDMPPRLFDFQIGWQSRKWTSDSFGYDFSTRVGAFSDFDGTARKGVRFPGHAVGYYRWSPKLDVALGVEVLDRDDITLLPVAGFILTPRNDLRLELVFPRPSIEVRITPSQSLYLAGEMGGGTWAIERAANTNDVVTYRDLRLLLGLSHRDGEGGQSGIELGYVFGRDLSYRSNVGDYQPGDTLLIRMTHRY